MTPAATSASVATIVAGVCRYCRCVEENACRLPDGDPCGWFDASRTVCTAPACINALYAARARAGAINREATRRRSPGEIHERILRDQAESKRLSNAKYRAKIKVRQAALDARRRNGRVA